MKLWLKYVSMHVKSQLQYRTSFILLCVGQFFIPFSVFAGLYFMFQRFGSLNGYTFHEVALCYAVVHLAFALSEGLVRGYDSFSGLIRQAGFDRLLLRPRWLVLQVLGSKFELTRIGRLVQGVVVLCIALSGLQVVWTPLKVITLMLMIIGCSAVFSGIFIAASTMCFWTVEGLEVINILTDGGRETAQYPLDIYKKGFRLFFTYVIPLGAASFVPLRYILDRAGAVSAMAPLYGLVFLALCVLVWYGGVRHYKSTGS